ncbi:hypothetical protein GLOIN_2v1598043 [Rhizophagus clarus]|uniref:SAM domain-containing protein n=1 Tax=Rhizophagus clarus TaxID=94130 RepID=A0A8H3L4S1_9GLOM|nr:hypothetical protein GLOIN_2v1598043 [Rhizophagus clarus]
MDNYKSTPLEHWSYENIVEHYHKEKQHELSKVLDFVKKDLKVRWVKLGLLVCMKWTAPVKRNRKLMRQKILHLNSLESQNNDRTKNKVCETSTFPSVDEIENIITSKDLIDRLRQTNLGLTKDDLEVLVNHGITGKTFLRLTEEKLEHHGVKLGPAMNIAHSINRIKKQQSDVYERKVNYYDKSEELSDTSPQAIKKFTKTKLDPEKFREKVRDEIRSEIRDEIRSEIRAVVKNFKDDFRDLLTDTYQLWISPL